MSALKCVNGEACVADPSKPLEFWKASKTKCAACLRHRQNERNAQSPDRKKRQAERDRARYAEKGDEIRAYSRDYHRQNRDRKLQQAAEHHEINRDRRNAERRAWDLAHPERVREKASRRRAKLRELAVEELDLSVLQQRDTVCYLCEVAFSENEPVHLDHKIPLSRVELGPTHSYDNCALVHPTCNLRKGTKTPDEFWARHPKEVSA